MSVKLTTIQKRMSMCYNQKRKLTLSIQTIGNVISTYMRHDKLICDE